jgi:hypothetical protein
MKWEMRLLGQMWNWEEGSDDKMLVPLMSFLVLRLVVSLGGKIHPVRLFRL